ncbi:MAG: 3-oxoacyl-[acyl-carrier-protein] reductase [Planctomycetota bacterium]
MDDAPPLTGRTALVTGASRGIGRAIALRLARDGAAVLCVATRLGSLAGTMDDLASLGATPDNGRARAYAADLGDAAGVQGLLDAVAADGLQVGILVNNAGVTRDNLLMRMSEADFDDVVAVNLKGPFLLCKGLARSMMKARDGRIINITSVVGLIGNAGQANYAASKAGLVGFTKSLARELAGRGVTANLVAPGFIETDMTRDIPEVNRKQLADGIPLGRFGSVEDVAGAVAYLAGPDGAYVTGQVLVVDGGMSM